jgi:Family of unknown function (DUF6262)
MTAQDSYDTDACQSRRLLATPLSTLAHVTLRGEDLGGLCEADVGKLLMRPRRPPPPSEKALQGLANHREAVVKDKRSAIEKAIHHLRETNGAINISTVATRAGVQRKTIYKHRDLVAVIDQYRRHRGRADLADDRDTSSITALRTQLAAKDREIQNLKAKVGKHESTIASLWGQLHLHNAYRTP